MTSDEELLARAYLSRVAEPSSVPLWGAVIADGPIATADAVRRRKAPRDILAITEARAATADPHADLEAALRVGVRLITPESTDWPHFALSCLEHAGRRRLARYRAGETARAQSGEPVPPLALWVRGPADISALGTRSIAVVGARAATAYGERVTADICTDLVVSGCEIVSGGAYGIDAAAHRAALAEAGTTVLVSAGGLDRPYPAGHADLYEQIAKTGLLVSESPPGASPARQRFLTRNRLIAALSVGTVLTEAAARSGALNTAGHCLKLGRTIMIVPGPVTSAMSVGTHRLVFDHPLECRLVTDAAEVLAATSAFTAPRADARMAANDPCDDATMLNRLLDGVDEVARSVYNGMPARRPTTVDELAIAANMAPLSVIRSLPTLAASGLVTVCAGAYTRVPANRLRR